ncbi:MAG: S24 family peptidase [Candidatus Andersenbacteria bacterium]
MYPSSVLTYPFFGNISAGWPSPAEEELIDQISFDELLIQDSSFMIKMTTNAMQDAGIHEGDIVIFQRGAKPKSGDIVIAEVESQWMMRYYQIEGNKPVLYPANGLYQVIKPEELSVIGVISAVIRKY